MKLREKIFTQGGKLFFKTLLKSLCGCVIIEAERGSKPLYAEAALLRLRETSQKVLTGGKNLLPERRINSAPANRKAAAGSKTAASYRRLRSESRKEVMLRGYVVLSEETFTSENDVCGIPAICARPFHACGEEFPAP